jgi:SOUL heme-binding protein
MRSFWILLCLIGLIMAAPAANAVEEPQWTLVYEDGAFSIRDYAPTVVAETHVSGERGAAINAGFRRLARFIFGGNEPNREIAMTAPVAQRPEGERIAMTAPVSQIASNEGWVVTFYMPPGSRLQDMPRPLDDSVVLREEAARRVAVLRFSGLATQSNLARHADELRQRVEGRGEVASGDVSYAFYNPPWTLPWARRNEVMIALRH